MKEERKRRKRKEEKGKNYRYLRDERRGLPRATERGGKEKKT